MNKTERNPLARELRRRREALLQEVAKAEETFRLFAEKRETELEELAQEEGSKRLLVRLENHKRRAIEEIDLALQRIAQGSYGTCKGCARPIPLGRLQAVPTARRCVDCAGAREKSRRELPSPETSNPGLVHENADFAAKFLETDDTEALFRGRIGDSRLRIHIS